MVVLRQILTWDTNSPNEALQINNKWASDVIKPLSDKPQWDFFVTCLADEMGVTFFVREKFAYYHPDVDDFIEFIKELERIMLDVKPEKAFSPLQIMM